MYKPTYHNDSRAELARRDYVVVRDDEGLFTTDRRSVRADDDVVAFDALTDAERRTVHEILFPEERHHESAAGR